MYKIIIWGIGTYYNNYLNLIKYQELLGKIEVIAVMSNETEISYVDTYSFINKNNILDIEFDYCVAAIGDFKEALREAQGMGIPQNKLIPIKVFAIPYFDFEKYINIKESNISIISRNCWAGICYNYLGLPFNSPFINMFLTDSDFNKLLNNFNHYMSILPAYEGEGYDVNMKKKYPIGRLEDILLHFNHYENWQRAYDSYKKRRERVNFDNLFFVSSSLSETIAEEYDKMLYKHKIIFVPFSNTLKSNVQIKYKDEQNGVTIGMVSNKTANSKISLINLLAFLNGEDNYLREKYDKNISDNTNL